MNILSTRFGKMILVAVGLLFVSVEHSEAQTGAPAGSDKRSGELSAEAKELLRSKLLPMARQILKLELEAYKAKQADVHELCRWSERVMQGVYQLADTKAKKAAAIEAHRRRLNEIAKIAEALHRAGKVKQTDVLAVQYFIAEADLRLLLENGK